MSTRYEKYYDESLRSLRVQAHQTPRVPVDPSAARFTGSEETRPTGGDLNAAPVIQDTSFPQQHEGQPAGLGIPCAVPGLLRRVPRPGVV